MAFTTKLTDTLKEACEIARADNASLYAFILKNSGKDAQSYAANTTEEMLFCVMASIVTGLSEATGLSHKAICKLLLTSMKMTGPITYSSIKEEDE